MPIYEYQCDACGHHLEALQKIAEAPLQFCPECGENGLKKLISKAAFRLKGGGWYETDFKNAGAKKSQSGQSENSTKQNGSGDASGKKSSGETGGKSSAAASGEKSA